MLGYENEQSPFWNHPISQSDAVWSDEPPPLREGPLTRHTQRDYNH